MEQFDKPILYLIFNRPEMVEKTFQVIKKLRPKFLYIAADGPRTNHPKDPLLCAETRNRVLESIDWDCKVKTLFRDKNLGCGLAISSALDWFFSAVPDGIIIEDDCDADLSFFPYAKELLDKYRDDERIMLISGNNRLSIQDKDADYFFSFIPAAWGWATWKRTWQKYDFDMKELDNFEKENKIEKIFNKKTFQRYWLNFFKEMREHKLNNWDFQLVFMCFNNLGLTIVPNTNLVTNIGTKISNGPKAKLTKNSITIGRHPEQIETDHTYDQVVMQSLVTKYYLLKQWLKKMGIFHLVKKYNKINK